MSEFPTCPEHQVLKPCPHCEPGTKFTSLKVCGDVGAGESLVTCSECGSYKSESKPHGFAKDAYFDDDAWGY